MTTTRTYEDIYAEISTATTAVASAPLSGQARQRARAELYERLAVLWAKVAKLSDRDRLPATSYLSARLLADRYADDAREVARHLIPDSRTPPAP